MVVHTCCVRSRTGWKQIAVSLSGRDSERGQKEHIEAGAHATIKKATDVWGDPAYGAALCGEAHLLNLKRWPLTQR